MRPPGARFALTAALVFSLVPVLPGGVGQPDFSPADAPERTFHDYWPRCNALGPDGMLVHDFTFDRFMVGWDNPPFGGLNTFKSTLRGLSGENGSAEWGLDNLRWHKLPGPGIGRDYYWAPVRGGHWWPTLNARPYYLVGPAPIDNVQPTADVDGDGTCDVLAYGWDFTSSSGNGRLAMLSGATGTVLWSHPISWTRTDTGNVYTLFDFPTGLLSFEAPGGPRYVWKTTDVLYDYDASEWIITEKIRYASAVDNTEIWTRDDIRKVGDYAVSTYLAGVQDVAGSDEPEVILDDMEYVPPSIDDCTDPLRITLMALRGEDGATLWEPRSYFTPPQEGTPPISEESRQCFRGSNPNLMGDIDADARPDIVATFLTEQRPVQGVMESGDKSTVNALYNTHLAPTSGATGVLLWGKDMKFPGWGYATDLNTPNQSHAFFGIGLTDIPTSAPEGARFPVKNVRMMVLRTSDGGPLWGSYAERFALDTYLLYDLYLQQYKTALAPHDHDGDGVRDLVTPARYEEPNEADQMLISGTKHDYLVLSGTDGHAIANPTAFGPRGRVVACPGEPDNQLTILSGHARRLDLTRRNVTEETVDWRNAVYINRRPSSQFAGMDTAFMNPRCAQDDGRAMFGFSYALRSHLRGAEIRGIHGYIAPNGSIEWVLPGVRGIPPNVATLDEFMTIEEAEPSALVRTGGYAATGALGLASGLGFLALRRRRGAP